MVWLHRNCRKQRRITMTQNVPVILHAIVDRIKTSENNIITCIPQFPAFALVGLQRLTVRHLLFIQIKLLFLMEHT